MHRLAAALVFLAAPANADQVTVFAAASLKTALDEIEAGAPADLFLSASSDWMDDLQSKGLIAEDSRRDLLGNTLVLVAHGEVEPVALAPGLDLPALLGDGRLAMAFVDSVPAGIYGREALTSLGLWDGTEPRVAQTENVRAALALVASGEAPLGIVYGSDAVAAQAAGEDVSVLGTFPADSHSPITYPAALVAGRDSDTAAALLDHLSSPQARAIWEAQGFTVLD